MSEEEIKEYLKRVDELELKLTDEDKDTYQWWLFGYNEGARLLNEKEQENKQLKEKINGVDEERTYLYNKLSAEKERLNILVNSCQEEIRQLKKQLEYLRSGEYYNQLRFERDMLQYVADNGKVSQEDKEFIDMTHRNTELLEVIEEVKRVLRCNNIEVLKYYDEPSETGSYEIVTVDLLQILDKVNEN